MREDTKVASLLQLLDYAVKTNSNKLQVSIVKELSRMLGIN